MWLLATIQEVMTKTDWRLPWCKCSPVTRADDMEEEEDEGLPSAVRLGGGATELSGDSGAGPAPSHSGQHDSTGTGNEGQSSMRVLVVMPGLPTSPCSSHVLLVIVWEVIAHDLGSFMCHVTACTCTCN